MRSSKMVLLGVFLFATFTANASNMDRQVQCMAEAVYFEAKSEPYDGKMAVAQVIKNRTEDSSYPDTVCKVVEQRNPKGCQFSWVCNGQRKTKKNSQQWEESVVIAQKALLFDEPHTIIERKNGLYFHATYVTPAWLRTKRIIARIGHHIFYSEKPNVENKRSNRYRHADEDHPSYTSSVEASPYVGRKYGTGSGDS